MSTTPDKSDSLMLGFILGWATAVLSIVCAFVIGYVIEGISDRSDSSLLAGVFPPLCLLGLLGGGYLAGKRQLARGVLLAFGSMFAIFLLLVAACFGAFGIGGF